MDIREYAKQFIGERYRNCNCCLDRAIAFNKGHSPKLTKVTEKGVKFEDGKFLPFRKFIETWKLIPQQELSHETPQA